MKSFLQTHAWANFQRSLGKKVQENPVAIYHPLTWGFYYLYLPRVLRSEIKDMSFFQADPKCIFIKIEPAEDLTDFGVLKKKSRGLQPKSTLVIDLKNTDEVLLEEMHQKTRYNIRLAKKHGVEVRKLNRDEWAKGAELISTTAHRQKYNDHGKDYYLKFMNFFEKQPQEISVDMTGAWYEGSLLAVGIFLRYGETETYLFGGSSESQKNLMAPYLLHWEKILEAKGLGVSRYDFWGLETGSGKSAGFARFKEGFGGMRIDYPDALDLVLRPVWYNAYWSLKWVLSRIKSFLRRV